MDATNRALETLKKDLETRHDAAEISDSYKRTLVPILEAMLRALATEMDRKNSNSVPNELICEFEAVFATCIVTLISTVASHLPKDVYPVFLAVFLTNMADRAMAGISVPPSAQETVEKYPDVRN